MNQDKQSSSPDSVLPSGKYEVKQNANPNLILIPQQNPNLKEEEKNISENYFKSLFSQAKTNLCRIFLSIATKDEECCRYIVNRRCDGWTPDSLNFLLEISCVLFKDEKDFKKNCL